LYRIAVNTAYSFYNKRPVHSEFDENLHSDEKNINPAAEDTELSDEEKSELVKKEIEKLSAQQKTVVYLKSYEGLKFREIADVLSLNEGTVKKYFHRAVENIRNSIDL
ncbi:MAG: RNA polymerase sigma factor, partial [Candidatus Delongbacteria bacterium]